MKEEQGILQDVIGTSQPKHESKIKMACPKTNVDPKKSVVTASTKSGGLSLLANYPRITTLLCMKHR